MMYTPSYLGKKGCFVICACLLDISSFCLFGFKHFNYRRNHEGYVYIISK